MVTDESTITFSMVKVGTTASAETPPNTSNRTTTSSVGASHVSRARFPDRNPTVISCIFVYLFACNGNGS
jgi:hypothetical protein